MWGVFMTDCYFIEKVCTNSLYLWAFLMCLVNKHDEALKCADYWHVSVGIQC